MKGLALLSRMANKSSCTGEGFRSGMNSGLHGRAPYTNSVGYFLSPSTQGSSSPQNIQIQKWNRGITRSLWDVCFAFEILPRSKLCQPCLDSLIHRRAYSFFWISRAGWELAWLFQLAVGLNGMVSSPRSVPTLITLHRCFAVFRLGDVKVALLSFQNATESVRQIKLLMRQWHFPIIAAPFIHLPNWQIIARFNWWSFVSLCAKT